MSEVSAGSAPLPLPQRLRAITQQIIDYYTMDAIPWVIGYSGGKDSTAVLQLVWHALEKLPPKQRNKPVHVITTDTRVENPIVSAWVDGSHKRIREAAAEKAMPFQAHMLYPDVKQTFWVNLIGRGYPAPRHKFRWCTERLKILPSNQFIRDVVRSSGEAMLVLGTRRAESARRASNMDRHAENRLRDRISPNGKLPNSLIYSPIEDWTSDEVWMYLGQVPNPWGHSNRDLVSMYRGASDDNECPLVVDTSTPSCGNSRFGCWVCTMVEKDKSMEAMILNDQQKEWMEPLLELRNELDIKDDRHLRDFRRMNGHVQLFHDDPIHGPYTKEAREMWLRRVLEAQNDARAEAPEGLQDIELIRMEELREIRRIWREEKHEFDDSLPKIYKRVTKEEFPVDLESGSLGADEWEVLKEVCEGDELLFDLAARLLDTERQFLGMSRRVGVYKELDRILQKRGHESREHAIQEARSRAERRAATVDEQLALLQREVSP